MSTGREPTRAQADACKANRLDPARGNWHGEHLIIPYWGAEEHWAIVSPHGSISYFPKPMMEAALAGIPS